MAISSQQAMLSFSFVALSGFAFLSFRFLKPKIIEAFTELQGHLENIEAYLSQAAEKLSYIERRMDQGMSTPEDTMRCIYM